jgi:excisionase family DNA binding protein
MGGKGGTMNTDWNRQVLPSRDRLISIGDAAAELRMSTRTIRRYIKKGLIRSFVIGGKTRRIRSSELEDFIKACEEGKSRKPEKRPKQLNLGFGAPAREVEDA